MTIEDRSNQQEESAGLPLNEPQELARGDSLEPKASERMSDEEKQQLVDRARELVTDLEEASGSKELELVDGLVHVGLQAQRSGGGELELLRTRVGDMMRQEGAGAEIANDLVNLRLTLDQISPQQLTRPGLFRRMFGGLPFIEKATPALRILQKIAIRYEPVSKQVTAIESRLREGRGLLARDNVELRMLYEQIEEQQFPIQKNAYLGELIMEELDNLIERTEDTLKAERIRSALHDVSTRVQDLRTMEQVYVQYFVSIDMTRQNNNRLGQAVERTLSVATNVVTVGLAIQTALIRQRKVMEANARTREFIGDLIVANASAIRQHTEEIGDAYNTPVIAIDKVTQAHNELIEAMDTADRLRNEGINAARENISKLGQLSSELQQRVGALSPPESAQQESVEA